MFFQCHINTVLIIGMYTFFFFFPQSKSDNGQWHLVSKNIYKALLHKGSHISQVQVMELSKPLLFFLKFLLDKVRCIELLWWSARFCLFCFVFFQFMHRLEFLNLSFFTLAHMKCQSFVSDGYTKTLKLEGE